KDLGFKIVMQAITDDVQLNRSLTQPQTIDINNIDSTKLPYLLGKGAIAPIPVAKYKLWSETVPLFTKGSYPNGKMATTQGLAPIEAMFYADKNAKTIKIMIDLKKGGHFRSFWSTFDQSVNLMASGEVVVQSMWSPAVTAVRSRGIDCYYVPLKEGYRGWFVGLAPMAHLSGL